MENEFGEEMSGAHTTADLARDVFNRACHLVTDGFTRPRVYSLPSNLFQSADIYTRGMELLVEKVEYFNSNYTT
jgi:hypothetical protein